MDDKELIKKIMEEVKDEKLREELLGLVVEKNKKKDDTKQEEEKPIDYVAKQAVLLGHTEGVAKVYWWVQYIVAIFFVLAGFFAFLVFLAYTFDPDAGRPGDNLTALIVSLFLLLMGFGAIFSLHSGKKEYEKLKRKEKN
jgi:phage shock protein PspC (stress-responsive transcriptional regulator)